jgi:hypothetical protein
MLRKDSGNRTHIITTKRITSGDELNYRNGLDLVADRRLISPTYRPPPRRSIFFDKTVHYVDTVARSACKAAQSLAMSC